MNGMLMLVLFSGLTKEKFVVHDYAEGFTGLTSSYFVGGLLGGYAIRAFAAPIVYALIHLDISSQSGLLGIGLYFAWPFLKFGYDKLSQRQTRKLDALEVTAKKLLTG